jgi:heat shock protein HslJ
MVALGVVALTLVSAGTAGCGGSQPSLSGTAWQLTGWSAGDQVGGQSAVNSYSGPYESDTDGSFSTGQLASTQMAGPEPAMRAETLYFELLEQAAQYSVAGQTLTLSDANGNELLIFTARE